MKYTTEQLKNKILKMVKRNFVKILTVCLCLHLCLTSGGLLSELFLVYDWEQIMSQYSIFQLIMEFIIAMILANFPVIIVYLAVIYGIKRFKKDRLSEIDFKNFKEYYREILKDYSSAELSYIDNFEIQIEKDIAATLLSLELNNKIYLGGEIQINDTTIENISSNEKYILDSIQDGKITNFNEEEFLLKVKEDAVKNGLLKEAKIEWSKFNRILIVQLSFLVCAFLAFTTLLISIVNATIIEGWEVLMMGVSCLLMIFIPFSIGIYFYTYSAKMKNNSCSRTKKGERLNEKLEGLKNYLKDFSNINERDEENLILWEDYLIYSVIFNQNTKIAKNLWDKYINKI